MDEQAKNKLRLMVQQKLVESGEKEKLRVFLRSRLQEAGYNEQLLQCCKNYIRGKGVEHVDLESMISDITPKARQMVPDQVKRDTLKKIRDFLSAELPKLDPAIL